MTEYERFCREAAAARGIHPDTAVLVFGNEGGFDTSAGNIGEFPTGTSYWAPQLHYAGGVDPKAGLGDDFTKLTGWQPGDPRAWRDALRFALNVAKKDGWRQWYAAAKVGVSRWYGIDRSVPWDANAETWDYERPKEQPVPDHPIPGGAPDDQVRLAAIAEDDVNFRAGPGTSFDKLHAPLMAGSPVWPTDAPPVTAEGHTWRQVALAPVGWVAEEYLQGMPASGPSRLTYNPDFPLRLQIADFACSIRTTQMLLESVGLIGVDIGTLQGQMVPRYVNSDLGLLDGSGAGIVRLLQESYGVQAHTISPVTFAQVTQLAGTYPIGIGGRGWNHWAAVRRFDGERLILANPGGTGPRYGQQTLDRQQFAELGPFSAVVVTGRL